MLQFTRACYNIEHDMTHMCHKKKKIVLQTEPA